MARFARLVIPGCPHHVTQRGNHRRTVFFADSEREFYLKLLSLSYTRAGILTTGYSLMTNHVHHVLIPDRTDSLARGVGRLHNDFSRWQQMQRNLTGHFWQNRFFSCPLDDEHFWMALRYVELNPVRAGLVKHAWDWPWSSARAHVTGVDESGLLDMKPWWKRFDPEKWKSFLEEGLNDPWNNDYIRRATRTGHPLGSKEFILRLEMITGRRLQRQKPGPKPRNRKPQSD